ALTHLGRRNRPPTQRRRCASAEAMLLFQRKFHPGLVSGEVTLTFRRWDKARVKVGGRYRCHPIGGLEGDEVSRVKLEDITSEDARRAGFPSRAELIEYLAGKGEL